LDAVLPVNDVVAAALGASVLRSGGALEFGLLYFTVRTVVGSSQVVSGLASAPDLIHSYVGGGH
jgi:hypothetical protein